MRSGSSKLRSDPSMSRRSVTKGSAGTGAPRVVSAMRPDPEVELVGTSVMPEAEAHSGEGPTGTATTHGGAGPQGRLVRRGRLLVRTGSGLRVTAEEADAALEAARLDRD